MKKLCLVVVILTTLQGCWWPSYEPTSNYEPIYLSRKDLNSNIKLTPPQDIINSGKIYIKDDLLFVGEKTKGFHVFDNSNPESPVKIKFLRVLAATDLAIRNNTLYINQATDLVALNYNKKNNTITITKRVKNTFPALESPDGYYAEGNIPEGNVIIDWVLK